MAGKPSFQFYPGDWMKDPALRGCEPATRGIWVDLLCAMWNGETGWDISGTLRGHARVCGCTEDEMRAAIEELEQRNVAEITHHGNGTVTVGSRRMRRDMELRATGAEKKRGQRSAMSRSCPDDVPVLSPVSSIIEDEDEDEDTLSPVRGVQGGKGRPTAADLEAIYQAYPRKVGKRKALDEIRYALDRIRSGKSGPDPPPADPVGWLESRVTEYAASPAGNRGTFTPNPSTWFHQDRFDDDPAEWLRKDDTRTNGRSNGPLSARQHAGLSIQEQLERGGYVPSDFD